MKLTSYTTALKKIRHQRNLLFPIVVLLGINQILLIIMLFWKDDRTVFMPPVLDKPFSIMGSRYSANYFEQMGVFLSNLLLTKTAETAPHQHQVLFKYVAPEALGSFKRDLHEEEHTLKQESAAYVFYPNEVKVNLGSRTVLLSGERHTYVGSHRVDVSKEGYRLKFVQRGHLLYLQHFQKEHFHE